MDIDWKQLIEVRERQKSAALELVAVERAALEASQASARHAHIQWREHLAQKAAHWQGIVDGLTRGAVNASAMRDAAGGTQVLEARIAQASQGVVRAQELVALQEARLEASRGELRAAEGELMKARRMHERAQAEARRTRELQLENAAEDAALQRWMR
jgi:hypothetical protein